MNKTATSVIVELVNLTGDLDALYQTFIAISDALENGADIQPRALFHPGEKLGELAYLIRDQVQILKEEAGVE